MQIKQTTIVFTILSTLVIGVSTILLTYVYQQMSGGVQLSRLVNGINADIADLTAVSTDYLLYRQKRTIRQWHKKHEKLSGLIEQLKPTFGSDPNYRDLVRSHAGSRRTFDSLITADADSQKERQLASQAFLVMLDLQHAVRSLGHANNERNDQIINLLFWIIVLVFGLVVVMLFLGVTGVFQGILRPLGMIENSIKRISHDNLTFEYQPKARGEYKDLARSFGDMVDGRREAERELNRLVDDFKATFEQAAVGIAHVGLDGAWLRVNQKLCDIVGYTREELLALTFQDITHPEDLEIDLDHVKKLLSGKGDTYAMEKRYYRKDGVVIWINLTVAIVRDAEKNPLYFISVVEDIDKRKRVELNSIQLMKKLTRSNAELENFAYVASHDLKSPLRGIDNIAQWLSEDLADVADEKVHRYLALLQSRVQRLEALLDGLLEYSRIGRLDTTVAMVDTNRLVRDIAAILDLPGGMKIEVGEELQRFEVERTPFEMVFRNLIDNAVKHHDRLEGNIVISCKDGGEFFEFSVSDDGPGIPREFHDKIFGVFQTLRPRDEIEGSGMGLAMVKKAVEYQGGVITVDSDPEVQRGATFRFTWPKQPHAG